MINISHIMPPESPRTSIGITPWMSLTNGNNINVSHIMAQDCFVCRKSSLKPITHTHSHMRTHTYTHTHFMIISLNYPIYSLFKEHHHIHKLYVCATEINISLCTNKLYPSPYKSETTFILFTIVYYILYCIGSNVTTNPKL